VTDILPGKVKSLGEKTIEKLAGANITSLELLAMTTAEDLKAILKITNKDARAIIQQAKDIALETALVPKSLDDLIKRRKEVIQTFSTGSAELDKIMGGGVQTWAITILKGPFSCHDEVTNILTPSGIKHWSKIELGDLVYSIDKQRNIIATPVKNIYVYNYKGLMYYFNSKKINLVITGNHTLPIRTSKRNCEWLKASEVAGKTQASVMTKFNSKGLGKKCFNVKEYLPEEILDYPKKSHLKDHRYIFSTNNFLELIGWYLSEGSVMHGDNDYISINNSKYKEEIKNLLDSMNLHYGFYENRRFTIFNKWLSRYCVQRCGEGSINKTIPSEILGLSKKHLKHLLKSIMMGDGSASGYTYYTVSPSLRDTFIILCLKLGYHPSYITLDKTGERFTIRGKPFTAKHIAYQIQLGKNSKGFLQIKKRKARITKFNDRLIFSSGSNNLKLVPYEGIIWCLETNGAFFVERNGKISLAGNSGKSQIGFQASVSCIKSGRKVGWVETEATTFIPERVLEIAEAQGVKVNTSSTGEGGDFVVYTSEDIIDVEKQLLAYEALGRKMEEGVDIGLLIVDSFSPHFRSTYQKRETFGARNQMTAKHLAYLNYLAAKYNVAILLTSQIMGVPDDQKQGLTKMQEASTTAMYGGSSLQHGGTHILALTRVSRAKQIWKATMVDSPYLPDADAYFRIGPGGISDVSRTRGPA